MDNVFIHLAIILFAAFIVSYLVRQLKQPIIIGYIIAGIIISPFIVGGELSLEIIDIFSEFGIAFLLFIVGLHMNPKVIREIGFPSLMVGLAQIILTFVAGFLTSMFLLGFDTLSSVYGGIALSFSSTIIIMKLLSDKKQLDSLHGKISIGILIVQDIFAIAVLMFISSFSGGAVSNVIGFKGLIAGGILIFLLFLAGHFVLPKFIKSVARSQELLFLFSIAWCFIVAGIFAYLGFSMEIGALVAGVILSTSPFATEISAKVRPLRDFFLIIFFIILGLKIQVGDLNTIIIDALVLSGIVILFKPFILMISLKFFKYKKRTNFMVSTTLAQISEFSIVVLGLGFTLGHISSQLVSTIILTLVITIMISSYAIIYSNEFYRFVAPVIGFTERKPVKKKKKMELYDSILFGYNRIGFSILNSLKKMKKKYLVVDFNPEVVSQLKKFNVPVVYGDVYDYEFLEDLPLKKISLAISTIPDLETNQLLLETIRENNRDAVVVLRAHTIEDALTLYDDGANYVLTPHFLGGEYVAKMIKHSKGSDDGYQNERKKHIKMLKQILAKGHEHPKVERN